MALRAVCFALPCVAALAACALDEPTTATSDETTDAVSVHRDGGIHKVKHVIVIMQENHSFDNYFGALAYAPGSPFHSPRHHHDDGDGDADDRGGCRHDDNDCVDGLSCRVDHAGTFHCDNTNLDDDGSIVHAFHNPSRCVIPDLDHGWRGTHQQVNWDDPQDTRRHAPMNGFVRENDIFEQPDHGVETPTDDGTMGFYTQDDLPFYYELAAHFAISDRMFSSVLGPTFPNRSYLMTATSFGHLTTQDEFPPTVDGYQPITGTIFDLLEQNNVSWADYFQDVPQGGSFRAFSATKVDPHFFPQQLLLAQLAGAPGVPPLPSVAFVDPTFGLFSQAAENDEHPPVDIQRGPAWISGVLGALRNGPHWQDSVVFITWDEHGGFYDHVQPPHAHAPDGIAPGQCADLSNPPASVQPGAGAECNAPLLGGNSSVTDAIQICPELAANPAGPYPAVCPNFDQFGVRIPFLAISPFAKRHFVSHAVADHTSILAFIETAFAPGKHLTERDRHANNLLGMFDFEDAPSMHTAIGTAAPPALDCTPR